MIDFGVLPGASEIEVTLIGPGYGEALAVHLGDDVWMLVDSCIDPNSQSPASLHYLERIGVDPARVRTIIASHWHDDHVRGISQIAARCPGADFVLSAVFNTTEAAAFAAAYSGESSVGLARGAKELYSIVKARGSVNFAQHKSIVLQENLNGRQVMVTALSPLPATSAQFVLRMGRYAAREDGATNNAPDLRPNTEAVALHIDFGDDAVLLGADLEEHHAYGWSAIANDGWSGSRRPATTYKVAHHGSYTGDCPQIWAKLLGANPVACLTPFTLGNLRLPSDDDKARVRSNTQHSYTSSGASRRAEMDGRLLKRLSRVAKNVAVANSGFGAVRLRKCIGAPSWNVELFGSAQPL